MGFDNECILNIQTLAGEYFCPVCRLLVYPNEALQSQCTHLYCKPCLTYVVSTTKACPYDGYLVTEADSKPLIESNKTLAETIGKITVHCLYHRSGCTWQGSLSECTSHCSGCAFGNSPVVCNRCGIQIVHRQVQEHAQSCPGVQTQPQHTVAQDTTATGTATASNQSQTATQAVTATSQAQTSQVSSSGQDPSLQTNSTTQPQAAMQAVVPTAEHWYQQQQQYQQYYQQYPGYDSYQQHYQQYYPYQQQTIVQYQQQPQAYMQPQIPQSQPQPQVHPQVQLQAQPQSHPQVQVPAVAQSQAQVNPQQPTQPAFQPQSQIQLQTQPTNVLAPQAQPHPQSLPIQPPPQQLQVPHYQQSHLQVPHSQPQSQAPVQGHSQHQPHLQAQPQTHIQHHPQLLPQSFASQSNQLLNPNLQPMVQHSSAKLVTGHNSFPQPQPHPQVQVGATKHPVIMHPQVGPHPQPHQSVHIQNQFPQQPPLLRPPQSHGIVQNMQQPGLLSSLVQGSNIPTAPQQPVSSHAHQPGLPLHQHPIMPSVQPSTHQQYVQQHQPYSAHLLGPVQNQAHQQGSYIQHPHVQAQLRPQGPAQSLQQPSNAYPQSQINVALPHGAQPVQDQNLTGRPMVPYHGTPYPQSTVGLQLRPVQAGATLQSGQQSVAASRPMPESQNDHTSEKGGEAESSCQKTAKKDSDSLDTGEVKTLKSESDLNPVDENRATREAKDVPEPLAAESERPIKGSIGQKDVSNVANNQVQLSASEDNIKKDGTLLKHEAEQLTERSMELRKEKTPTQDSVGFPPHGQVQGNDQGKPLSLLHQRPVGPPLLQTPPRPPHHTQLPGPPSAQLRPSGPGHIPHPGQVLHQPPEHVQHPVYKQPHGPEISSSGIPGPGSTSVFGRGPSHYGHLEAYNQGHGREPEMVPNAMRMNGAPVLDSSSTFGLRDDRFRPLTDEHLMSFPPDPTRRVIDREFEDLKHFPRPSHLDTELPPKFGSHFSLSKPLDRGPRGLGIDVNSRSLDKGHQLIPLGGPAPSSFFPHIHDGTLPPNDLVERPVSFQDNTFGRSDAARAHPDFLVPSPGYGRRHMDGLAQRSPGRDYSFLSSREFGAFPGLDDIDGRESRRFGGPFSTSVHDGRLPPRHLHRDEFEGLGHDGLPYYLRRGEHFGPRDLPNHLRLGEHVGFGVFPGHAQMGHLDGPRSFGHPRLGDPGYRSSFSMKGFPNDGGRYAGDFETFDNSRKRKPSSIGWCRICKVDCETVEGLDLHSQTREHQKMAMDMVITIKQNAKKQKLASTDLSSIDDASKSKTASFEGTGNKH